MNGEDSALVRSHRERLSQVYFPGGLIMVVTTNHSPSNSLLSRVLHRTRIAHFPSKVVVDGCA